MSEQTDEINGVPDSDWWYLTNFSEAELFLLRSTFVTTRPRLEAVAVSAFVKLFDKQPDAFSIFIGKKVLPSCRSDVAYSWETKQHGLRVLSIVEKCLNRMKKWKDLKNIICGLARRHLEYGAKPIHVLSLFGCLREALLSELENSPPLKADVDCGDVKYDLNVSAINAAWNKFFRALGLALIAEMLVASYEEEKVCVSTPASLPQMDSSVETSPQTMRRNTDGESAKPAAANAMHKRDKRISKGLIESVTRRL